MSDDLLKMVVCPRCFVLKLIFDVDSKATHHTCPVCKELVKIVIVAPCWGNVFRVVEEKNGA